ncbi:MAG: hypothetical protein ACP5QO_16265 [Clostridia bacterium]
MVPVDPTVTRFNTWLGWAWEDWLWEWLTDAVPLNEQVSPARCDAILTAVVNRRSAYQQGVRSTSSPTEDQWNQLVDQLVRLGTAFAAYPDALESAGALVSTEIPVGHGMARSVHGLVDFWIGDTLWDSKLTGQLQWRRAHWAQLIAY